MHHSVLGNAGIRDQWTEQSRHLYGHLSRRYCAVCGPDCQSLHHYDSLISYSRRAQTRVVYTAFSLFTIDPFPIRICDMKSTLNKTQTQRWARFLRFACI